MHPSRRRGNALVIVSLLCGIVWVALSSLDMLTSHDQRSTSTLVTEFQATSLAESIAIQIESLASRYPWERRFWFLDAQAAGTLAGTGLLASTTLDKASPRINLTGDALKPGDYDFVAIVKDLDTGLKEYRIYVEISLGDEKYAFSWDKRFQESLLGALNRDGSRMDKVLSDVTPNSGPSDKLIEKIKDTAAQPPPNTTEAQFQTLLKGLRTDTRAYQGATQIPPEPTGVPQSPPPPTLDPATVP